MMPGENAANIWDDPTRLHNDAHTAKKRRAKESQIELGGTGNDSILADGSVPNISEEENNKED